jgi:hypothetical protein
MLLIKQCDISTYAALPMLSCFLALQLCTQFAACTQHDACNQCLAPFLQIANAINPPQNIQCTEAAADDYLKKQVPAGAFSAILQCFKIQMLYCLVLCLRTMHSSRAVPLALLITSTLTWYTCAIAS